MGMERPEEPHTERTLETLREIGVRVDDKVAELRKSRDEEKTSYVFGKISADLVKGAEIIQGVVARCIESQTVAPVFTVELSTTVYVTAWSEDRATEIAERLVLNDSYVSLQNDEDVDTDILEVQRVIDY